MPYHIVGFPYSPVFFPYPHYTYYNLGVYSVTRLSSCSFRIKSCLKISTSQTYLVRSWRNTYLWGGVLRIYLKFLGVTCSANIAHYIHVWACCKSGACISSNLGYARKFRCSAPGRMVVGLCTKSLHEILQDDV